MKETTSLEQARTSYNVRHWSQGFFGINDQGDVYVAPKAHAPEQTIALIDIAQQLQDKGLSLPALVRFPQILHHRVHSLCQAFNTAIENYGYLFIQLK